MKLTRRQRFLIRLRMRYKFRREYFTLAIPVGLALMFVFFAFHSGFASIATPASTSSQASANALKEAEYQAISGNLTGITGNTTKSAVSTVSEKQNLYITVVAAPILAFAPFSIDATREERKRRNYEQDFSDFLFELSELVRGGIDPSKAFLTLAEGSTGSITKFVKTAAKQMQIGFTFEQALQNMGNSIDSDLAKRYIDLVIQASYSGGSVANLIQRASIDMGSFVNLEREKRAGLSQYTVVLYTGQVILIVLAAILVVEFIPQISNISSSAGAGLGDFLGKSDIGSVDIERGLFFLVFLNGALGGLVIGKISEGKIKFGLKHSLVLILIALLAWNFYVIPASSGTQQVKISVVSYDQSGPAGLPMVDPLVVNVTNPQGKIIDGATVTFVIGGGGTLNPSSTTTDEAGQASTQITLGDQAGLYAIIITCDASQLTLVVNATGYQQSD